MNSKKQNIINIYGKEPSNLDELGECVIKVINNTQFTVRFGKKTFYPNLTGLKWQVTYNDNISNSHNAPLSGVTNFSRKKDMPLSYPGFSGRIWAKFEKEYDMWINDAFEHSLIYTGSGGFGGYSGPWSHMAKEYYDIYMGTKKNKKFKRPEIFSWDVRFFIDDWEGIYSHLQRRILIDQLKSNKEPITHTFFWENDLCTTVDNNFIEYHKSYKKEKCTT